jgi:methyl-accepting chemotaxis protein
MTKDGGIQSRLNFTQIDQETRKALRELKPLIAKTLPEILDEFYRHIGKFPEMARHFPTPKIAQSAKDMQIRHWATIASADFDETYVTSVNKIGEVHNRIGLEPRWYIGGYSFLLSRMLKAVEYNIDTGWFGNSSREKKANYLAAITQAGLLDMDYAISVYLEAGARDKSETLKRLGSSLKGSVGRTIENVAAAAVNLEGSANTLTHTAMTTQQLSAVVAGASEQASANVHAVAAATHELTASVTEIGRQVQLASRIASEAVGQAHDADTRIIELSNAAQRIGEVVTLIATIAEQTNLLALNATIEAARAGSSGKGFAVVASEVKALATQTASATNQIRTQIDSIQAGTLESVASIKIVASTIAKIAEISSMIAGAVEEQGAATEEIARNVQNASNGTAQVAENIDEVNRGAVETGLASGQVLDSVKSLSAESIQLRDEVEKFVNSIRAG